MLLGAIGDTVTWDVLVAQISRKINLGVNIDANISGRNIVGDGNLDFIKLFYHETV